MSREPIKDALPERLLSLAEEAVLLARQICAATGGPGSSALVHHASALRSAIEIYWQSQRRLQAEILRQLEIPHHAVHALLPATDEAGR